MRQSYDNSYAARLTERMAAEVKANYEGGMSMVELAERYRIPAAMVRRIVRGLLEPIQASRRKPPSAVEGWGSH